MGRGENEKRMVDHPGKENERGGIGHFSYDV